jgi:hypothetical protein
MESKEIVRWYRRFRKARVDNCLHDRESKAALDGDGLSAVLASCLHLAKALTAFVQRRAMTSALLVVV